MTQAWKTQYLWAWEEIWSQCSFPSYFFFKNADCSSTMPHYQCERTWKNTALTWAWTEEPDPTGPEGRGEKMAWLPYSAIAHSLAQGGQPGFLKSKTTATADLSHPHSMLSQTSLTCSVCVSSYECECECKCIHRGGVAKWVTGEINGARPSPWKFHSRAPGRSSPRTTLRKEDP